MKFARTFALATACFVALLDLAHGQSDAGPGVLPPPGMGAALGAGSYDEPVPPPIETAPPQAPKAGALDSLLAPAVDAPLETSPLEEPLPAGSLEQMITPTP